MGKNTRWGLIGLVFMLASLCMAGSASAQENFTLNFQDADITTLISTISELTGKNFVVDPRVKAKVTVISSHPMSKDAVYQTFLSILQVHGFAAVPSGQIIKIIPEILAKQEASTALTAHTGHENMVTQVVGLHNVQAAQLVAILRPLVPQAGHLAAYVPGNMLIISDHAANVRRLMRIIDKLDQGGDSQMVVIPLKYASAGEVVRILTSLDGGDSKKAAGPDKANIEAYERTNSVIVSGSKTERLRIKTLIAQLDTPVEQLGGTRVVYLHYAKAEELAKLLQGYGESVKEQKDAGGKAKASTAGFSSGDVSVLADESTNALVITAPPKIMGSILGVVRKLDIRRAQVLVQAIIAEVSVDKSRSLGVDWAAFEDGKLAAASLTATQPSALAQAVSSGNPIGLLTSGLNLAAGNISSSGVDFVALLHALQGDGTTNILSTPTLVTLDNEEASIKVGQEVPFTTGSFTNAGGTTGVVNPFQTIERKDVGLSLKITPQINEGDSIMLKIEQETSSLAGNAANTLIQTTNKRTISTTVLIDSGNTLVLGGLIDDQVTQSQSKVPLLGDIPILGVLFRNDSVKKTKQNLMVFIRPVILRNADQAGYYTRKKYKLLRNRQLESRKHDTILLPGSEKPALPPVTQLGNFRRQAQASAKAAAAQAAPSTAAPAAPPQPRQGGTAPDAAAPAAPETKPLAPKADNGTAQPQPAPKLEQAYPGQLQPITPQQFEQLYGHGSANNSVPAGRTGTQSTPPIQPQGDAVPMQPGSQQSNPMADRPAR